MRHVIKKTPCLQVQSASVPCHQSFKTPHDLHNWFKLNYAIHRELWVRIFKKHTSICSVTWDDCVIVSLAWGWIDSQRRSLDDASYLQRLSPRRPGSVWSKKNCQHVANLIAKGEMQPAGMVHVESAKKDGRWDQAYSGSADMVIPQDFLSALAEKPAAQKTFDGLRRKDLFAIYSALQSAKRPETRTRRLHLIVSKLENGELPF